MKAEYKALYDRIQPSRSIERETEAIIMAHIERKAIGTSARRSLVIAAILAALLLSTAVAATLRSHILDRLFGSRQPSPEAEQTLVRGADSASDEGITLTLDEYLADGKTLNLSWTVASEREEPVYYVTWEEIDDGGLDEPGDLYPYDWADSSVGDGAIVRLTPRASRYTSGRSAGLKGDGPVKVTVHAMAFTTALEARDAPFTHTQLCWAEEGTPEQAALHGAEQEGRLLVASDLPLCYVTGYAAYQQALTELERDLPEDLEGAAYTEATIRAENDALSRSGLFTPLTELTVEATVVPPRGEALYTLPGPVSFSLPGRTVELKTLNIDVASTMIAYDVTLEGEREGGLEDYWYLVADPSGRVLNVDWQLSMSGESETIQRDGEAIEVLHYSLAGDSPVTRLPDSLTFIPVRPLPRREGEPSQDYWQRVADLAAPEERFEVAIAKP